MLTKLDLSQIKNIVQTETKQIVSTEIAPLKRDIKTLKTDVKKIKKTMSVMLDVLDREDVRIKKRVEKIEDHLGFTSS